MYMYIFRSSHIQLVLLQVHVHVKCVTYTLREVSSSNSNLCISDGTRE